MQVGFLLYTLTPPPPVCLSFIFSPYFLLHSKRGLSFNGSIIKCCRQQAPVFLCTSSLLNVHFRSRSKQPLKCRTRVDRQKELCNAYKIKAAVDLSNWWKVGARRQLNDFFLDLFCHDGSHPYHTPDNTHFPFAKVCNSSSPKQLQQYQSAARSSA